MDGKLKGVEWEAYEHSHSKKSSDWFWVLGILTLAGTVTAMLLSNPLLGILLLLAGMVMAILSMREARVIPYAITIRGIRVDDTIYPFSTLHSYCIDDTDPLGPQILIRSQKILMPLLVIPIPEDEVDEIEDIIAQRLTEEHLEEPLVNKLLEFFGF